MPLKPQKDPSSAVSSPPPVTPPSVFSGANYDFLLQGIFDLKGAVSKLDQAVATLIDEHRELRKKVEYHSKLLFAASIVGTIVLAVSGWFLNRGIDVLIQVLGRAK